jgi:hypothetical protein
MRLSRDALGKMAAMLLWPVLLFSTSAQEAGKTAPANRQLRRSGVMKAMVKPHDPKAPAWEPGPIPETITIAVSGVARDEAGRLLAGATITLYSITDKGSKPVGTATTDGAGRYAIREATLPVLTSFGSFRFPREITPYGEFIVSGQTPGLGIAWSPQKSMYALKEPHPNDIQGRLPLGQPVEIDLTFPRAGFLEGKVVDEKGRPVEGAKVRIMDADLLDDAGNETNHRQGYDWSVVPGGVGRAVTDREGRFRLAGIADRACYWLHVNRPETESTTIGLYAATIGGPDRVHEQLPAGAFNGRGRHDVKTNPITVVFPRIRPIAVTVVGDDTGRPIAGARVFTLRPDLNAWIVSGGTTDASGKALLGLPPGEYRGLASDPSITSHYIRTSQGPLVVERGEGAQAYELRQKAGTELIIEAVRYGTQKPFPDAFFWKAPEDAPDETQTIEVSTFQSGEPWTDAKGQMRAVLPPEPGRRYRFRFAGLHEPNMPGGVNPDAADKHGFEAFPTQSAPVELLPGKTIHLRFIVRERR